MAVFEGGVGEMEPRPTGHDEVRPPKRVKLLYGLGHMHEGAFNTAIGFIFFYYTAVLGLSGSLVGTALFIGLCFDAGVDPFIGSWSDNIRSRLGRRVPLMMVGAPLMALALGLLFSPPPGLSQPLLFGWLLVTAISVRTFMSLFHVPYVALGAELAQGYAERSSVVAYRSIASLLTAVAVTAMAYSVFFAGKGGLQRPENYPEFGWSAALLMFIGMAICCIGMRTYAARLPQAAPVATPLLLRLPGEVMEIFRNRSFRVLFLSAVTFNAAVGLHTTLNTHVNVFVWELQPGMIQTITYSYLGGILVGIPIAPLLARFIEKKAVVLLGLATVCVVWSTLPSLRALGVFNAEGAAAVLALSLAMFMAGVASGLVAIAYPSMMADAADEHEHVFGRRREGLYFAGLGFAFKAAIGVGLLLAGVALDLLKFPKEAGRTVDAALPDDLLTGLVLTAGPGAAAIGFVALLIFLPYGITRRRHDEIASALRMKREILAAAPAE